MTYRVGRRNGHTIYETTAAGPDDTDPFVGSCVTPDAARRLVGAANTASLLAEARSLMRTARALDPTKPMSNELLGQVFGDLIELLAPDGDHKDNSK